MNFETDINLWINWALYAVCGLMAEGDSLMATYPGAIERAAAAIRKRKGRRIPHVWRGVIVEPGILIDDVLPVDARPWLSCSLDVDVARWFADPDAIVSEHVKAKWPRAVGYVASHEPAQDEVLFDYRWMPDVLQIASTGHPDIDPRQFHWNLCTQQEVIIKARALRYAPLGFARRELDGLFAPPEFR